VEAAMRTALRAAIVGAGYWGANLIRVLQNVDGLQLTTICDSRTEIQQDIKTRYPHISFTPSWQHLLRDSCIDVVFLATPPATHYNLAMFALASGKHVWVEKPLALSTKIAFLYAFALETQRTLFVVTFCGDPVTATACLITDQLGKSSRLLERHRHGAH
jgi:predicted dehydrogenase